MRAPVPRLRREGPAIRSNHPVHASAPNLRSKTQKSMRLQNSVWYCTAYTQLEQPEALLQLPLLPQTQRVEVLLAHPEDLLEFGVWEVELLAHRVDAVLTRGMDLLKRVARGRGVVEVGHAIAGRVAKGCGGNLGAAACRVKLVARVVTAQRHGRVEAGHHRGARRRPRRDLLCQALRWQVAGRRSG